MNEVTGFSCCHVIHEYIYLFFYGKACFFSLFFESKTCSIDRLVQTKLQFWTVNFKSL